MKTLFKRLYQKDLNSFKDLMKNNLINNKKMFIVTANPETFMKSNDDIELKTLLNDDQTTLVPDGIGIVKAAKMINLSVKERITGIDLSITLLNYANEMKKTLYLFGARKEVIKGMQNVLKEKYPNIKLLGATDGYVKDKDEIFNKISKKKPDIILVALGIPTQEKLIYKHLDKFSHGIFMGVGGSFDVISGYKKRAPKLFIKLNLEWLYRIMKEPKRIKRFYNSNVKFLIKVKKLK